MLPRATENDVTRGVVGRERVGTAFLHLFHVLLQD